MKMKKRKMEAKGNSKIGIIIIVSSMVISLLPLLSMLSAALAPQGSFPAGISLTLHPQWHNFADAAQKANIWELTKSSTLIVLGVIPAAILFSTMAAYAIIVLKIPFAKGLSALLLITLTLPFELNIVPLYYQLEKMNLLNSRVGLCLALIGLNMPFSVTWMQTHFRGMPVELTEAASIDGAGSLQNFLHVQLPLALPAMAANTMLMFLSTWNNFVLPLVLINDPNRRTMAGALQAFVTQYSTDQVLLNAGAILLMLPTMLVFLLLQKHFVAALLQGSVKG